MLTFKELAFIEQANDDDVATIASYLLKTKSVDNPRARADLVSTLSKPKDRRAVDAKIAAVKAATKGAVQNLGRDLETAIKQALQRYQQTQAR